MDYFITIHCKQVFTDPLQGSEVPSTAWLHVWEYVSPDSIVNLSENEMRVQSLQDRFPSYYSAVCTIVDDVKQHPELLPYRFRSAYSSFFYLVGCWILPLQISFSRKGRRIWLKVLMSYVRFFFMSIGIWNSSMWTQLNLSDNFHEFEGNVAVTESTREQRRRSKKPKGKEVGTAPQWIISNPLLETPVTVARDETEVVGVQEQQLSDDEDDDEEGKETEELIADYERRSTFVEYLSALTSCRSVMWQLIPGMTAFAIIAVDTASCPIFIFSDELHKQLTPLIMVDAWTIALDRIKRHSVDKEKKPQSWQVAAWALFIFVEESRLVQFFIMMMINFVAFCIVFSSIYLQLVLKVFLAIFVFNGAVRFFFTMVPLYQFFFPAELAEEESLERALLPGV